MKNDSGKQGLFFLLSVFVVLFFLGQGYSRAQDVGKYPERPITLINPSLAGSTGDTAPRLINREAEKLLGQPIVVVNKPGGSMTIGVSALAASKPDGYTIGHTPPSSLYTMPFLIKTSYNPVKDLRQIMGYGAVVFGVFVRGDSPFKSFKDLLAYAHEHPGKATYGAAGVNSIWNLVTEYVAKREGVKFTHIPLKGGPDVEMAVLGGHINFGVGVFTHSLIQSGQLRLLLLMMEERLPEYPQVPTIKDIGYNIPCPGALNVAAPKGIPDEIAERLEQAFTKAMTQPAFINGMKELHLIVVHRNSRQLTDYVASTYDFYGKLIKEMGWIKQ